MNNKTTMRLLLIIGGLFTALWATAQSPTVQIAHACEAAPARVAYSYSVGEPENYYMRWLRDGEPIHEPQPGPGELTELEAGEYEMEFYTRERKEEPFELYKVYSYKFYQVEPTFDWTVANTCNGIVGDVAVTLTLDNWKSDYAGTYTAYLENTNGQVLQSVVLNTSSHTFSNVASGTYTLRVASTLGGTCEHEENITVVDEDFPVTVTGILGDCNSLGGSLQVDLLTFQNGDVVTVTVNNDSTGHTFTYQQTTASYTLQNLPVGPYTISLDNGSCVAVRQATIHQIHLVVTPGVAEGNQNPCDIAYTATLQPVDNTAQYSWQMTDTNGLAITNYTLNNTNSYSTAILAGRDDLAAGTVTATTSNGCSYSSSIPVVSKDLFPNGQPTVTVFDKVCSALGGVVRVDISGRAPHLTITSIALLDVNNNNATAYSINSPVDGVNTFTGVAVGTYIVSYNVGVCGEATEYRDTLTIIEVPFEVTTAAVPYCLNGKEAKLEVTSRTSFGATYAWTAQGSSVVLGTGSVFYPSPSDPVTGSFYTVAVTDNGCTVTSTIAKPSFYPLIAMLPNPIEVVCGTNDVKVNFSLNDSPLNDNLPDLPYQLQQNTGSGWVNKGTIDEEESVEVTVTNTMVGQTIDWRVISVHGCVYGWSTTIGEKPMTAAIAVKGLPTNCQANNGSLEAYLTVPPSNNGLVSYNWSTGETTQRIYNLSYGTYTVTISYPGCAPAITSYTINQSAGGGIAYINRVWDGPACGEGRYLTLNPVFSTPAPPLPYTYSWEQLLNGGQTLPLGNSPSINKLQPGIYNLTVTDANGCQYTQQAEWESAWVVTTPSVETLYDCAQQRMGFRLLNYEDYVDCDNIWLESTRMDNLTGTSTFHDSILMTRNGVHDYWFPSSDQMDPHISYSVQFNNCCNEFVTTTLTFNYLDAYAIVDSLAISPATCQQAGGATLLLSGAAAPYQVIWPDGVVGTSRSDLPAGQYRVNILSQGACSKTELITIPGSSKQPQLLNPYSCGGSIPLNASNTINGTPPYSYQWQLGTGSIQTSSPLTQTGHYQLTITDANGCTGIQSLTVSPETFTTNPIITPVSCRGNDGAVALSVQNSSSAIVDYSWLDGNDQSYSGQQLTGLSTGMYQYTITDARGCTLIDSVLVDTLPSLTANFNVNNCVPAITLTGGLSPYQVNLYTTDSNAIQNSFNYTFSGSSPVVDTLLGLHGANYSVSITDANGCQITQTLSTLLVDTPRTFSISMRWRQLPVAPPTEEPSTVDTEPIRDALQQQANQFLSQTDLLGGEDYCQEQSSDSLNLDYDLSLKHYTLYYYNLKDELVRTVPPEGVAYLSGTALEDLLELRKLGPLAATQTLPVITQPNHKLVTTYDYNALGQLVHSFSPDKGATQSFYTSDGLLRFAQDAQQKEDGTYSYTLYDELRRIVESGEMSFAGVPTLAQIDDLDALPSGSTVEEWVKTYYTIPHDLGGGNLVSYYNQAALPQQYLRNRVSYTQNHQGVSSSYSYDIHGNVEWIRQYLPNLGEHYIAYEYDLITQTVQQVKYDEYSEDRFFHRYEYDAQKRLKEVYTSKDGIIWDREAHYQFYAHGPLKRTELGEDRIQGLDYVYTIHGWIKAVNHPHLHQYEPQDPGQDGYEDSPVMKDVHSYALGYYQGDYSRSAFGGAIDYGQATSLYNGNIAAWSNGVNTTALSNSFPTYQSTVEESLTQRNFRYDELNRIKNSHLLTNAEQAPDLSLTQPSTQPYSSWYSYDGNGNLQTLTRNHEDDLQDDLVYTYGTGRFQNRLLTVVDNEGKTGQKDLEGTQHYSYDSIGNIINMLVIDDNGNNKEELDITWRVDGKVDSVYITNFVSNTQSTLHFLYDASGNRIAKVYDPNSTIPNDEVSTYHVRDASGNILATYVQKYKGQNLESYLKERTLYGSKRLGIVQDSVAIVSNIARTLQTPTQGWKIRLLGGKSFELSDHLGNVTMTVSDWKQLVDGSEEYEAQVLSYEQYYPFGSTQGGRGASGVDYRFGFNGKENDKDFGNQLIQDYGFRLYNPAIAKFLSVDPLAPEYPMLTPYQFASNSPIAGIDLDGLEFYLKTGADGSTIVKAEIVLVNTSELSKNQIRTIALAMRKQFVETMTVYDSKNEIQYRGQLNFSIVDNVAAVPNDAYYINLSSGTEFAMGVQGRAAGIGGTNAEIGVEWIEATTTYQEERVVERPGQMPEFIPGQAITTYKTIPKETEDLARTGVHEILHMMGLLHPWDQKITNKYGTFYQSMDIFKIYLQAVEDLVSGDKNSEAIKKLKENAMNTDRIAKHLSRLNHTTKTQEGAEPDNENDELTPGQLNSVHNNIYTKKVGKPRSEQEKGGK